VVIKVRQNRLVLTI